MNFTLFYFSGTGNTRWSVLHFCTIAASKGHYAKAVSIDRMDPTEPSLLEQAQQSDCLGFAYPIYAADLPRIMRDFISSFTQRLKEKHIFKPVFFLCTFGYVNGFGPINAARLLRNAGLPMVAHLNLRFCNNATTPILRASITGGSVLQKRVKRAKKRIESLVDRLAADRRWVTGVGPYLIPGIIIRRILGKLRDDNYKSISIDMARCSRCMLCVRDCPTGSFRYEDSLFTVHPTCTSCMRCYNFCPSHAVQIGGYADPVDYPRYRGPAGGNNIECL